MAASRSTSDASEDDVEALDTVDVRAIGSCLSSFSGFTAGDPNRSGLASLSARSMYLSTLFSTILTVMRRDRGDRAIDVQTERYTTNKTLRRKGAASNIDF